MSKSVGILIIVMIIITIIIKIMSGIFTVLVDNISFILIIIGIFSCIFIAYKIYVEIYFRSEKFLAIKKSIESHIDNCNDLNHYIEELKGSYVNIESYDYGTGTLSDDSRFNFQRKEWNNSLSKNQIYQCSASVCQNANSQPMKYLIKYFNIEKNEESLAKFEKVLNDFESVEQGTELIQNERETILGQISNEIPFLIRKYNNEKLTKKLGFESVDISHTYFPIFTFQYISAGGNSSTKCEIKLNIDNLNRLINYLNDEINWRKSVAGQRGLMTSKLRIEIKERDNFQCCICKNGTANEPNLLLEIDHIIPLAKGGITSYNNLQTLCWKCNRAKGSKILEKTL